jgi:RHS repeat-associated protein
VASCSATTCGERPGASAYVARRNDDGSWAWLAGAVGNIDVRAVAATDSGAYVTGSYTGPATFGAITLAGSPYTQYPQDGFVAKIDSSGAWVWARTFTASSNDPDYGEQVEVAPDGTVWVVGTFRGSRLSYAGAETSATSAYANGGAGLILHLTSSGELITADSLSAEHNQVAFHDLAVGPTGRVFVAGTHGRYYSTVPVVVNGYSLPSTSDCCTFDTNGLVAEFRPADRSFAWGLSAQGIHYVQYGDMDITSVAVDPATGLLLVGGRSYYCGQLWDRNDTGVKDANGKTDTTQICGDPQSSGWLAGIDPDGATDRNGQPWGAWTFHAPLHTKSPWGSWCSECRSTSPPTVRAHPGGGGFYAASRVESYLREPHSLTFDASVSARNTETVVLHVRLGDGNGGRVGGSVPWGDFVASPATDDTSAGLAVGPGGIYLAGGHVGFTGVGDRYAADPGPEFTALHGNPAYRGGGRDGHLVHRTFTPPPPPPPPVPLGQTFGATGTNDYAENPTGCCGDPVNTATGSFFDTFTDLALPGAGVTFSLDRAYNSQDTAAGVLGQGWSHPYEAAVTRDSAGNAAVKTPTGQRLSFTKQPDGALTPTPGVRARLTAAADGQYTLTTHAHDQLSFNAAGQLTGHVDRSGTGLTFTYNDGRLTGVRDAASRTAALAYHPDGKLASVTLPDGRNTAYTYSGGRLSTVRDARGKTTTYAYDSGGRLSSALTPSGHYSFRNTYDSATGRITRQLDALDRSTSFAWDPATTTATVTDPRGGVTKHAYTTGNVLLSTTAPDGATVRRAYDGQLNITSITDERGHRTTLSYDLAGNLLSRTGPAPSRHTETFTYNDRNDPLTATDRRGATTTYSYDTRGRLSTLTDRAGHTTTHTYTELGQLATVTDPRGGTTSYSYDAHGNRKSQRSPAGRVTTWAYDLSGRLTSSTDPRGNTTGADPAAYTTTYTYDASNRLLTTRDPLQRTTTNTYDDDGRPATVTDAAGNTTRYEHDAAGNLTAVTAPDATVTRRTYDANNNITSVRTPEGRVTTYGYDLNNRLTTVTSPRGNAAGADPDAHTWTYTYDPAGNRTTTAHPSAGTTTITYDEHDRPVAAVNALGHRTAFGYDPNGNLTAVTDPTGATSRNEYDPLDRPVAHTDPSGDTSRTSYDANGNTTARTTALGHRTTSTFDADNLPTGVTEPRGNLPGADPAAYTTTVGYDPAGQPTTNTDPLGNTSTTAYDPVGNITGRTDRNGRTTAYRYDTMNRLDQVTGPDGAATVYTYDSLGNLRTRTDANTRRTTYTYTPDRDLSSITDPLGRTTRFGYDPDGNRITHETPLGTATTTAGDGTVSASYDALGRQTGIDYSDNTPDVAYTYNPLGQLTAMADGIGRDSQRETYTYDPAGRLTGSARGTTGYAYAYDLEGNLTARTYPDGNRIEQRYDADNRLTAVTRPTATTTTTTFGYDAAGRLTSTTLPTAAGHVEGRNYDNAGRLTTIATTAGNTVVSRHSQTLDPVGNPLTRATTRGATTTSEAFAYDPAHRLTKVCYAATCTSTADALAYSYDRVGNRLTQARTAAGKTTTTNYTYDAADQLTGTSVGSKATTHTHDANGRQTAAGTRTYTWGLDNRLLSTTADRTTTAYTYDGAGRRITEATNGVTNTRYSWDIADGLPMLALESDAAGKTVRRYTHANSTALSMTASTGTSYYAHDLTGSVSDVVNSTNTVEWQYAYEPFGAARSTTKVSTSAADNRMRYTGEYLDTATGLYHLRARQYDPATGRFLSTDPMAPRLDDPYVSAYVYVNNRPGVYTDPTGMVPEHLSGLARGAREWGSESVATVRQLLSDPVGTAVASWDQLTADYNTGGGGGAGVLNSFNNNINPLNNVMGGLGWIAGGGSAETGFCMLSKGLINTGLSAAGGTGAVRTALRDRRAPDTASSESRGTPQAAEGAGTEVVQRWMSRAELDATRKTGLVRGGRDGTHYVTDAANSDPLRARQRLALPQTPEVRVDLEVPSGVFSAPSKIQPDFHMPGGGLERTATGPVPCRVLCVWEPR